MRPRASTPLGAFRLLALLGQNATTTVTNIQGAYDTNVHGAGTSADATVTTMYLRPDMGYSAGVTLDCSACHDPHGTPNSFALNASVKSANGGVTLTGRVVYRIPGGGYDMRFFCGSCHQFDSATHDPMAHTDTTQFGQTDCTSCHRHVRADGSPSTGL